MCPDLNECGPEKTREVCAVWKKMKPRTMVLGIPQTMVLGIVTVGLPHTIARKSFMVASPTEWCPCLTANSTLGRSVRSRLAGMNEPLDYGLDGCRAYDFDGEAKISKLAGCFGEHAVCNLL